LEERALFPGRGAYKQKSSFEIIRDSISPFFRSFLLKKSKKFAEREGRQQCCCPPPTIKFITEVSLANTKYLKNIFQHNSIAAKIDL
jgi:hypothetical protein